MALTGTVHVVHFPTRTSTEAAARVRDVLQEQAVVSRVQCIDARPSLEGGGHLVLLFPILGDDRMPPEVDTWLSTAHGHASFAVCVTGDLRNGQTESPVAHEAERLLRTSGAVGLAPPLLLDTPVDWDAQGQQLDRWLVSQLGSHQRDAALPKHETAPGQDPAVVLRDSADERPLRRIVALVGAVPCVTMDDDGRCQTLSFQDRGAYPRSLVAGMSPRSLTEMLEVAHDLPRLQVLGLPYAGLDSLPAALPSRLLGLDLRGNAFRQYDFLAQAPSLQALNLTGCDLRVVPDPVADLGQLHTLILAKNRLKDLPDDLARLQTLERLTVYRNDLSRVPEVIQRLRTLRLLNLGANWVSELSPELAKLEKLEVLGLRLLPLRELPAFLADMPSLRVVDRSKSKATVPYVLGASAVVLADGMPRWQWDDLAQPAAQATGEYR